jgi:hypothetical protein
VAADVLRSAVAPLPVPIVLTALVVVGLVVPLSGQPGDALRASVIGWVWVVVLAVLFAPQGVFFPRQLYVVAAPYTLVLGLAWAMVPGSVGWRRWVLGGAAALATALILWQSPVVWGPDPVQHASWVRHDALVHDIDAAVAELPLDAVVLPVVPYYTRPDIERFRAHDEDEARSTGRQAFAWVSAVRGTRFTTPVSIEHDAADPSPAATRRDPGRATIRGTRPWCRCPTGRSSSTSCPRTAPTRWRVKVGSCCASICRARCSRRSRCGWISRCWRSLRARPRWRSAA